ncbi:FAD-dependent oxidoreductase [Mycolicibacterium litorale]|uniref:FAD-dependent oxidoreductase n=1 Tax=Mycolicibacterium litorale TaxID=758802 RepID=UPI003CF24288
MNKDEVDVVVVGSGGGGLGAALTAAAGGATVVLVEALPKIGGGLAYSDGQVWCGANHLAAAAGMPDSPEETSQYLEFLSRGVARSELRDNFVRRAPEAIKYFTDLGIEFDAIAGLPDYYFPSGPGSKGEGRYLEAAKFDERRLGDLIGLVQTSPWGNGWATSAEEIAVAGDHDAAHKIESDNRARGLRCTGQALAAALVKQCHDRGVDLRPSTCLIRLTVEDGRVTGVVVEDPERTYIVRARRGVVLATGGYDHNADYVRTFDLVDEIHSMAPPTTTGIHFKAAGLVGAEIVKTRPPNASPFLFGFHTPGDYWEDGRPKFRMYFPGSPHSIFVNRFGRRFTEDATYHHIMEDLADVGDDGELVNWPTWLIVDQNYRDKYPLGLVGPGQPLPDGMAVVSDSLRGLAEAAGIDPDGLEAGIARWNELSEIGSDEDFGRGTFAMTRAYTGPVTLGPIVKPPFVAIKLARMSLNQGSAGVRINENAQVIALGGEPIPGLFASGNAAASLDIGAVYQSGLGNSRGLTYGYIAAKTMLGDTTESA